MTHVLNNPAAFRQEMLDGFLAAYSRYVERVPGASGVMRRGGPIDGRVSVIIGGGSGHYPAFAGLVGPGLAHGAVVGDIFTSPSAEQIYRVGLALDGGAGILFSFGNYAGDVMNFGSAEARLRSDGIDCRTVLVTDDVASAPLEDLGSRRGVAGDFAVFKIAGAAADAGKNLDEVERVARKANSLTRSYGVAFAGCTLPGQTAPLFTVEPGSIELGLGIHGEPGVSTVPEMKAVRLAAALVEPLLEERPEAMSRAAVVLNGLGATKYEELFVLYSTVHSLLSAVGIEMILAEVGEIVTSLDMAGCSLSITWLDDELERLWRAPADSPAFRRDPGTTVANRPPSDTTRSDAFGMRDARKEAHALMDRDGPQVSDEARGAVHTIQKILIATRDLAVSHEDEWGRLDAVAGDGDHGAGMRRGMLGASDAASGADGGPSTVLATAADAFADRAGGSSGALWGAFLAGIASGLPDDRAPTASEVSGAMSMGADALQRLGKCELGDKTMYDALDPFTRELARRIAAGESLAEAWGAAADVANDRAEETSQLMPRLGRARPLGERSLGTPDPGAVSMAMCLSAAASALKSEQGDSLG